MIAMKCCDEEITNVRKCYMNKTVMQDPQKVKLELTPGKIGAKWAKSQWKMHGRRACTNILASETGALSKGERRKRV